MSINVDRAEVAKFEALANKWWDQNSEFRPLHQINPLRANWIDERATLAEKSVLDVGCGGGILAEAMVHRGANVLGIDMGEPQLNVAKLHALETKLENIDYKKIPVEELAELKPGQFDVITCMEMLEHVPDPASIVEACAKLVKPGGQVYFSTLNRNPKSYVFAIIGAEYILNLLPRGTHDYRKFIKPSELATYARKAGLNIKDSSGLTYNPLTKEYKLTRDVSVNYMIQTTKDD